VELYWYRAQVIRVIDGDTIEAKVSFGDHIYRDTILRFAGINAPEHNTPEGAAATTWLTIRLVPYGVGRDWLIIHTVKDVTEKYGRLLAELYGAAADVATSPSINAELIAAGHARAYDGGPRGK
jgi:micrococcal nuclease